MSALEEIQAAIEGVRKASADIPIIATMTFDTNGRTMMGVTPEQLSNFSNSKRHGGRRELR